jgi:hypothetical protein
MLWHASLHMYCITTINSLVGQCVNVEEGTFGHLGCLGQYYSLPVHITSSNRTYELINLSTYRSTQTCTNDLYIQRLI